MACSAWRAPRGRWARCAPRTPCSVKRSQPPPKTRRSSRPRTPRGASCSSTPTTRPTPWPRSAPPSPPTASGPRLTPGSREALANEDPPAAAAAARRAIELDPALVDAHLFLASAALDADKKAEAQGHLTARPRRQSEQHRGARARGGHRPRRRPHGRLRRRCGEGPGRQPGPWRPLPHRRRPCRQQLSLRRRRADGRKGVALEPDNPRTQAALGLHLLRVGDERGARRALETAFRADAYDVVTYNLLQMLDSLDTFTSIDAGPVIVKLHPNEAPALRHYAVPMVKDAMAQMRRATDSSRRAPSSSRSSPSMTTSPSARSVCRACSARSAHLSAGWSPWTRRARGRPARSTGRPRSGTRWRTCSRCSCRTTGCRAGSPRASRSTKKACGGPSGPATRNWPSRGPGPTRRCSRWRSSTPDSRAPTRSNSPTSSRRWSCRSSRLGTGTRRSH